MLKPINASSKVATIGMFIGACVGTVAFVADTPAWSQECRTLLRVVGVAPDDVLYLRFEPRVPNLEEESNKLIGIPAEARWIEQLAMNGEWRLVRYMGIIGYAKGTYLRGDGLLCRVLPPLGTQQSLSHDDLLADNEMLEQAPVTRAESSSRRP